MLRRLALCLCLLSYSVMSAAPAAAQAKPNILWLIAEDFGQHLSCYGTKEVATPNLDAFAANGMRFTRYFTTAPVCSPSRSAMMTGMYQTTIGAHQHRTADKDKQQLPSGVKVVNDWLREAGYFTANVREFPDSVNVKGSGKTDWNFKYTGKAFDSANWSDLKQHQPFYAQVNFQETHRTFHAPPHADPQKVEIPPYYPEHPIVRQDWAEYLDAATELDRKIGRILKQLDADGLSDNTIIVFVGDNGQAHVRAKQFCYDSGLLVPLIVSWPAALKPSADFKRGSVSDRLLLSLDVTAQTLSWAGVTQPPAMHGQPFFGPNAATPRDIVFGARDRCDQTNFRFRTARDARYRYIRNFTPDRPMLLRNDYKITQYPVWNLMKQLATENKLTHPAQLFITAPTMPIEELYDTAADPHETVNLATSKQAEHVAALTRLRAATVKWIADSNDQGRDDDYSVDWEWANGQPEPKAKSKKK